MQGSTENEEHINLELTLAPPSPPPPPPAAAAAAAATSRTPSQRHRKSIAAHNASRGYRPRRRPALRINNPETIDPAFPWSTNRRAKVHTLSYLLSHEISSIDGDAQCKQCNAMHTITFDLISKFSEVVSFITRNKAAMHNRAPVVWRKPKLPTCPHCGSNESLTPVRNGIKKRNLNWLFLLLGQLLGCLKLKQLIYFCKHNELHRTGSKDRILYSTYICLCKQLDPTLLLDEY